jgi:hypothetical protein
MRDDYLCGARLLANNTIFATSVVNVQYRKEEFSLNEMTTSTLTALTDCSEVIWMFLSIIFIIIIK